MGSIRDRARPADLPPGEVASTSGAGPGESVRRLGRFGRRYAAAVRLTTFVPIATIGALTAPPAHVVPVTIAVGVLTAWTCAHSWWLIRARGVLLPLALDVAVLLTISFGILMAEVVGDVGRPTLRLLVTFATVTYQWYASPLAGGIAALVAIGGMLGSSVMIGADANVLHGQAWVLVAAALSRATWTLVLRAATRADALAAEAERVRRASDVEAAVRADQRELANSLHDTAATTLLMVGVGQVPANAGWLAAQARRDLERLHSDGQRAPEHSDLVALLREDLDAIHLAVELHAPARLALPFGVARAMADAAREALNNVRRHAGADRAVVRLRGDPTGVRLEITDEGKGFAVDEVPGTRRGLRNSVHERMSRIGGTAVVDSVVGSGTAVRLEWHG
jgi:signal transduction histidine kinase